MKTLNINRRSLALYTISDVARALGQPTNLVWYQIKKTSNPVFKAPDFRVGNRDYYREHEFAEAVAACQTVFGTPVEKGAVS